MEPEDAWRIIIEKDIMGLRNEVESIKRYLYSTGDIKKLLDSKLKLFEKSREMRKVYLRCNGENTRVDISDETGILPDNVSRAIARLRKLFLVYEIRNSKNQRAYSRNLFDEQMGLVKILKKLYPGD